MRRSMSAQSHASVPPAPELMLRMQLFRSCGPLRKTFNSRPSTSLLNLARSRSKSAWCLALLGFRFAFGQFDHDAEVVQLLFGFEEWALFFGAGRWPRQSIPALFRDCSRRCPGPSGRPVRPAASARPARQRNLRKWTNFSPAADNCALMFSNISGKA